MAEKLSEIMKDEKDVEGGSIATCRICLQCADGVKGDDHDRLVLLNFHLQHAILFNFYSNTSC